MTKVSDYKTANLVKVKAAKENEILRKIRFLVPAQNATISPPIGPILGQFGINIMDFCKQFNERSRYIDQDVLVLVILTLYKNKTFTFIIKTPPISFLVNEDNYFLSEDLVPKFIDLSSLYKIFQLKKFGMFQSDLASVKSMIGTVRSMHIQICKDF
jgi:large subunit ribosomal protein L11